MAAEEQLKEYKKPYNEYKSDHMVFVILAINDNDFLGRIQALSYTISKDTKTNISCIGGTVIFDHVDYSTLQELEWVPRFNIFLAGADKKFVSVVKSVKLLDPDYPDDALDIRDFKSGKLYNFKAERYEVCLAPSDED